MELIMFLGNLGVIPMINIEASKMISACSFAGSMTLRGEAVARIHQVRQSGEKS